MGFAKVRTLSVQLTKSGVLCGSPDRSYTDDAGYHIKSGPCEDCDRLSKIVRKCLRCSGEFKPGCGVRHTCPTCYNRRVR